jgi:oxygen-independent coproporphyrinogen-3 oxidase
VNIDLMYGLPHQTTATIRRTIERILEMEPDRLALFGYAHVPWAKPNQRLLPQAFLPGPEARIELFLTAAELLEKAGFSQVGLDHFARRDDELGVAQRAGTITRNFQGYSSHAAPDTVAFGPSAISDIDGVFLQNAHLLKEWMRMVRSGQLPVEKGMARTDDDRRRGYVISTLMCHLRLDFAALEERFGPPMTAILTGAEQRLSELERDGLIARTPTGLEVLPLGRLFLRNIAMAFDAYLANHPERSQLFSKAV